MLVEFLVLNYLKYHWDQIVLNFAVHMKDSNLYINNV